MRNFIDLFCNVITSAVIIIGVASWLVPLFLLAGLFIGGLPKVKEYWLGFWHWGIVEDFVISEGVRDRVVLKYEREKNLKEAEDALYNRQEQ